MTDGRETFVVKVTDSQGRDLFAGSFQAATYHRALRVAWSETTDDRPLWPTDSQNSPGTQVVKAEYKARHPRAPRAIGSAGAHARAAAVHAVDWSAAPGDGALPAC